MRPEEKGGAFLKDDALPVLGAEEDLPQQEDDGFSLENLESQLQSLKRIVGSLTEEQAQAPGILQTICQWAEQISQLMQILSECQRDEEAAEDPAVYMDFQMELLSLLRRLHRLTGQDPSIQQLLGRRLLMLGCELYQEAQYRVAESAFAEAMRFGIPAAPVNLGYMARRSEVARPEDYPNSRILTLFWPAARKKDGCAVMNLALTLGLRLGAAADWQLADELVRQLPAQERQRAANWWGRTAEAGDPEGCLVLLWLALHGPLAQEPDRARCEAAVEKKWPGTLAMLSGMAPEGGA